MCSSSPALIVSLGTGFAVPRLREGSPNPCFPSWGAPAKVSRGTCDPSEPGFCREAPGSPKHVRRPGSAGLSRPSCRPGLSRQLPARGRQNGGSPLCSPRFWGERRPRSRVRREKARSSRSSADWLLCYYPETGPGAERGCGSWGAPARWLHPGGPTPAPPSPQTAAPLPVPSPAFIVPWPLRSQPPLGREFI